jgi:hypothetical protein
MPSRVWQQQSSSPEKVRGFWTLKAQLCYHELYFTSHIPEG